MVNASSEETKADVEATHQGLDRLMGGVGRMADAVYGLAEDLKEGCRLLVELADALDEVELVVRA